ncbi:MAG: NUDIX hydrolase [Oscillospiraceae bacterium]|nr:NUDIX hydrolase [Oscillospiraceae bacterium]MCL2227804.1 NUDIX hydrolase [Oscillospiraceae bacterium]
MNEYIKHMRKLIGHERLQIVGASVIIHKNGKLLLQKRRDNGCWGYHGGGVELGENVEEAAKRELTEETGLTAKTIELLGVFSGKEGFFTYPNGDLVSIVDVVYLCDDFSGEMMTCTSETTDLRWFDIDSLPDNLSPPVKPALAKCVEILKDRLTAE